ncbi:hypothetical protein GGR92_005380 [Spirosoma lacussanchae]|uniref:hypothetical protein n=1 Tax=Spirosoma lacussanchae TaxID=1884249 RepID=UPI001107B824|nr:hypothetical protein [Spirosoma lacussanchae]
MYTDFKTLPDGARVWVYQASRPLSDADVLAIEQRLKPALSDWAAHGQPLLASAQVVENRFVVVGVDEGFNLPSGCSIDASVRTLREIGQQLSVDFFDRSAAIRQADGAVGTFALPAIKAAVANGTIQPDTPVFNTLVKTKAEFLTDWQIRAADSWLKRYFSSITA